mmetsp:Transcript_20263/g.47637  ORF Transcript_20263/g.47637 Transcript_20263/m.47637 type:complete len:276 (+) Transcript_20263:433-1260(+)
MEGGGSHPSASKTTPRISFRAAESPLSWFRVRAITAFSSGTARTRFPPTPLCPIDATVRPSEITKSWSWNPRPNDDWESSSMAFDDPGEPDDDDDDDDRWGVRASARTSGASRGSTGRITASKNRASADADAWPFAEGSFASRTFLMLNTDGFMSCWRPRYLARDRFAFFRCSSSSVSSSSRDEPSAFFVSCGDLRSSLRCCGIPLLSMESTARSFSSSTSPEMPAKKSLFRFPFVADKRSSNSSSYGLPVTASMRPPINQAYVNAWYWVSSPGS